MRLVSFIVLVLLQTSVYSRSSRNINPEEVPNPVLHYSGCGRDEPSYVCDPSYLIEPGFLKAIDGKLDYFKSTFDGPAPCQNMPDLKSYEVGVAIVESMERSPYSNKLQVAKEFASKLFDYWGVGDPVCNNGILIFLSIDDRVGFIATGKGANYRLTNEEASRVITKVIGPHMRQRRYGQAILAGLSEIDVILQSPPKLKILFERIFPYIFFPFIFGIFGVIIIAELNENRTHRLMQERVRKLENDRDKLNNNEFHVDTCTICLKDITFEGEDDIDISRIRRAMNRRSRWSAFKAEVSKRWSQFTTWLSKRWIRFQRLLFRRRRTTNRANLDFNEEFRIVQEEAGENLNDFSNDAFAIRCGHIFCERCIKPWLEYHNECPVCKQPVFDQPLDDINFAAGDQQIQDLQQNGMQRLRTRAQLRHLQRHFNRQLFWDAMDFRARRLHALYPRYVNSRMVEQFRREPRTMYLTRHQHYVAEQKRRADSKKSSKSKSKSGFGGGRSFGGGGGGW